MAELTEVIYKKDNGILVSDTITTIEQPPREEVVSADEVRFFNQNPDSIGPPTENPRSYVGLEASIDMPLDGTYNLQLPTAQGGAGESLSNDGTGQLEWTVGGVGDVTYTGVNPVPTTNQFAVYDAVDGKKITDSGVTAPAAATGVLGDVLTLTGPTTSVWSAPAGGGAAPGAPARSLQTNSRTNPGVDFDGYADLIFDDYPGGVVAGNSSILHLTGRIEMEQVVGDGQISIGVGAGVTTQDEYSVAIGENSATTDQGSASVAIGYDAGKTSQSNVCVAIGKQAGEVKQGQGAVAIGFKSGYSSQKAQCTAVGFMAGYIKQQSNAVAVGYKSGYTSQDDLATAVGYYSGHTSQREKSTAVGWSAGRATQGSNAVAVGGSAGDSLQGDNAIAIGSNAGTISQDARSIILNASGAALQSDGVDRFFVKPIRGVSLSLGVGVLYYDSATSEIQYSTD